MSVRGRRVPQTVRADLSEHTTTWRRGLKATEAYDRQQLAYDLTGHRRGRFRDAADIPALRDWDDQD